MPTINKGSDYFGVLTYTGDGAASKTVVDTNAVSFTPDFVWIKGRSGATDHALYDAVRGTTKQLESNTTTAETTETTGLTSFVNGGFTVGNLAQMNTSGATYVAWCWKAGGSTSSNTSGSITSTVSVNTTAGFSIVTYTGNSTDNTNYTVGHGLGVKPAMIIVKNRDWAASTGAWVVWHQSQSTSLGYLNLTAVFDALDYGYFMGSTQPTNSVFTIRSDTTVSVPNRYRVNGGSTYKYVAYCWAEIAGFSKFGSYTGNGSADGPFVYLGFRPKFVLIKRTDTTASWELFDTSRNTYNSLNLVLYPNLSDAEGAYTAGEGIDSLSNGFKLRKTGTGLNNSGGTYIYMAFAENPFSSNNRAR